MVGFIEASLEFADWWQSHGGSISADTYASIQRMLRRLVQQDQGFLETIEAGEPAALLIYADWLEEHGDNACAKMCRAAALHERPQAMLRKLLAYQRDAAIDSEANDSRDVE